MIWIVLFFSVVALIIGFFIGLIYQNSKFYKEIETGVKMCDEGFKPSFEGTPLLDELNVLCSKLWESDGGLKK